MPKWFNLLKPGIFETIGKDNTKKTVEIKPEDLDGIVKNYNAADFAAAFTLGHPKTQKEPAYGFVSALRRVGDMIQFTPGKVVAEFSKAVNDGLFPRVSAGLEKSEGKGWGLNHIAFLGAWKPAVAGLGMVEFAANEPESVEAELAEWKQEKADFAAGSEVVNWLESRLNAVSRLLSGLRDFIIEKNGVDVADKFIGSSDLEYIGSPAPDYVVNPSEAAVLAKPENDPDYRILLSAAEKEKAELASALQTANERITALEKQQHEEFLDTAKVEFASYVDSQVEARRVLPAEKDFIVNTLVSLSKADTVKGNDIALLATPDVTAYKQQIEKRPQHNLTVETAGKGAPETEEISAMELAGYAEQHVQEQTKAGKKISYADAVGYVRANPKKFVKQ